MVQLWLQWYFPKFWAANLEFPKGLVPARILAKAPTTNHSTLAYLYFFRIYRTLADLEWVPLCSRDTLVDQLFQDSFGEVACNSYKDKFISCIWKNDLAWGIRSNREGYKRGLEVYYPNFYGRQLGFRQVILDLFFDYVHCGTSYCLCSSSKATFWASRRNLEVMSKIIHKLVALNFECTSLFTL